jgi:uncharacterized protein
VSEAFSKFKTRYILIDIVLAIIVMAILLIISSVITGMKIEELSKDKILEFTISPIIVIGLFLRIFQRLKNSGIRSQYLIGNISPQVIPWMMLLIIFYGVETLQHGLTQVTMFSANLIIPSFVESEIIKNSLRFSYHTDYLALTVLFYLLIFISAVVIAPLTEEFLFRGVFLHRFSNKWGIAAGIVISSMLFGLSHANLSSIAIGISFIFVTLSYIKFQSMLVPIAYHTMHNTIWFISKIVTEISGTQDSTDITLKCLWFGLLNISFALPILFYFLKWPNSSEALPYNTNSQQK